MPARAGLPDVGGARETFGEMGDRLANMGCVVLIPDIYYRAPEWDPHDVATLWTDQQEDQSAGIPSWRSSAAVGR